MTLVQQGFLLPYYALIEKGYQDSFTGLTPANGQPFTRKTPGDSVEVYLTARTLLSTDATVANRFPQFRFIDGDGTVVVNITSNVAIPANSSCSLRGLLNITSPWDTLDGTAHSTHLPLAQIVLIPGWKFSIQANNLQAGDGFLQIGGTLQRFPTGGRDELPELRILSLGGFVGSTTPFPGGGGGASAPAGGGAAAPTDGGSAAPAAPATVQVATPQYSGAPPGLAPGTRVE